MPTEAVACLDVLVRAGLGDMVSLGGALGLLHYIDYRATHDVHAWWSDEANPDDRSPVVEVVETTLRALGELRTRSWGDVVSVELQREGKTVFGFQIASQSASVRAARALGARALDPRPAR